MGKVVFLGNGFHMREILLQFRLVILSTLDESDHFVSNNFIISPLPVSETAIVMAQASIVKFSQKHSSEWMANFVKKKKKKEKVAVHYISWGIIAFIRKY